ncbi:MAG: cysteine--tRNA ligase [Myxococcales bacterium]|nr:cysteine--tRNA ligase [Myxococcales bacterium]
MGDEALPAVRPPLSVYDSLTRSVRPLAPRRPGELSVYCCGPTTYDVAHVGHARSAVAFDLFVRVARSHGLRVQFVRNVTDVDDKILARAKESGEEPPALAARMAELYAEDMRALGCADPDVEPRVSQHIAQIHSLVTRLVASDSAYVVPGPAGTGGDVYFRVRAFAGYGKLSGRKLEELQAGARVEVDERKQDPLDFALWKGCAAAEWGWDSPWGRGRPGWHIECSAMSEAILGHGFDIHAGGMDLIFPHHENEIAQSEAAFPARAPFARTWMHNGFVNVDKEKMSKSLGNFVTLRDVLARNDGQALRLYLLSHHYRGPVSFDVDKLDDGRVVFPGIDEAERKIEYLYTTLARLDAMTVALTAGELPKEYAAALERVKAAHARALAALADDLGAAAAIAATYEIAGQLNEAMDLHQKRKADRGHLARVIGAGTLALREITAVLGLLTVPFARWARETRERRCRIRGLDPAAIEAEIQARADARAEKDFARGDAIRAALAAQGVELLDGPSGTTFRVAV